MRGAASDYEKAMQFTPDLQGARNGLSSVHYNQGHLKEQRGDLSGAADEYSKALELNPDNPEAASAQRDLDERRKYKSQQREGFLTF